tara:strand:+ start:3535 stop:4674 length:1140 start_codon:yes stop_codon:yes gene_type:complete
MLYYLSEYLTQLAETNENYSFLSPFRVFTFGTARAGGACVTAFLLTLMIGPAVIRKLVSLKVGQPIRTAEEVHALYELHEGKGGTPTMGGVMILGTILASTLLWARLDNPFIMVLIFVLLTHGYLGFRDDYAKVTKKSSAGVSARFKLFFQFFSATAAGAFLYFHPETKDYIRNFVVPGFTNPFQIENMVLVGIFVALTVAVILGSSNAVNLTDGLDGLAIGCIIVAAMTFAIFSYVAGHSQFSSYLNLPFHKGAGEVSVFCTAMVGAGLGFLWFNCYPARVFMGDTGSLSLGGLLGTVAVCCRQELMLVVVGGVFVIEALSVILQVGSFKLRGKRIFKMAPIHHHFELMGWKETKVITRFWIVAIMLALAGLATLKIR